MPAPASPTTANEPTPRPVLSLPEHAVVALRPAVPEVPRAAPTTRIRVVARLASGEQIEVGAHAAEAAAKAEATALMRFLREAGGDWPFLSGRFVRPEAIVSVDILAS